MTTSRNSSRNRRARRNTTPAVAPVADIEPAVEEARLLSHQRWQEEYGYVFRDLRKLLIVSGSLFAVIILLSFVL